MNAKGTVLIVDDTIASLKMLAELLTEEGYTTRPANSGRIALAAAFAAPPEIILLDIRMPGMDGFEVAAELKKNVATRDIPILFLSAHCDSEERTRGLLLGAVDFLTKPVQRDELLARVANHLELSRLRLKLEEQVAERTRELVIARDLAETANRAKTAFLANMSHEIRTPLNAITGFAQIMQNTPGRGAEDLSSLVTILQNADRLLKMVSSLIEYSSLEAAPPPLQLQTCTLAAFLDETVTLYQHLARKKGLVFADPVYPAIRIVIDDDKLRSCLRPLLDNAVKYTASGGLGVAADHAAGQLRIEISDSGLGIAPERLAQLFAAFNHHSCGTVGGGGLGLGLGLARRYAQILGGSLSCRNNPSGGATFTVAFPCPALPETHGELPPCHFSALPPGLQSRLRQAIVTGNLAGLTTIAAEIQPLDPALSALITEALDSFDFSPLKNLIKPEALQ